MKKVIAKTKPYAKQLGKKIAESALDVGKESLKDIVINRKSPKEVVKNKSNELKRKIIGATSDTLKLMEGKGYSSHVKRTKTEQKQSKKIKNQKKKVHKPKKNNKKNKKKNRKSGKVVKTGKKTIKNKVKAGKKTIKNKIKNKLKQKIKRIKINKNKKKIKKEKKPAGGEPETQ